MATGAAASGGEHTGARLTIQELSRRTGMSVRNIRAHQSRGLLPRPLRQGRQGYYTTGHVERILRIQQLQAEGFNLASIAAALDATGGGSLNHRNLQRLAFAPLLRHEPFVLPRDVLVEMMKSSRSDDELRRATEIGMLTPLPDGSIMLPSRQLAMATRELVELGFHASDILALQEALVVGTRQVAEMFVELCLRRAWAPFADQGYPAERWLEVRNVFERLNEQTTVVLMATLSAVVRLAAEQRVGDAPAAPAS